VHQTPLITLLVAGFLLAFLFGALAQRLRLSPLVGYLMAGVVAGPFTPGFVGDASLAPQLAEIGVILLMFGVGLHFSIRDLLAVKHIAVPGALAEMSVVATTGGLLAHFALGFSVGASVVFGLSLSVASTVVLMRALEDRRLVDSGLGRIAVGWLVVEDLAMVLVLVLLPAVAGALRGEELPMARLAMLLGITLLKMAAFIAFMLVIGRRVIPWVLERVAGTASRELFTLCVLTIALGVAFGSATLFGVSLALGAFFAGMILNESEFSHQAANETLPLRDAFAVLFFVSVGMLFDPAILIERPLQVLATFTVILLGKSLTAWTLVRLFGRPQTTALTIAASLAQIGEFSFILAGLGLQLHILPPEGQHLILAGALLSISVNPLLFAWLDRRQARLDRASEEGEFISAPVPAGIEGHVLLIGYGRVGHEIGRLLHAREVTVVVIDDEALLVDAARRDGLPAVRGNALNPRVLAEAAAVRAHTALVAIPNALEAGEIIAVLRTLNPALSIVARAHSDTETRHLLAHGADAAVMAERELAHSVAEMVLAMPIYRGERHLPRAAVL